MKGSATAAVVERMRAGSGWRRRRAARRLAAMACPEAVGALARAAVLAAPGVGVAQIARRAVASVADQAGIDAACAVWGETGDRWLGGLIIEAGWVASGPAGLRVATALHAGRGEVLADGDAEVARLLVAAASASGDDPAKRGRAGEALRGLRRAEAREWVCALAVDEGDPVAVDAALAGGFAPADPVRRALLLFLAGEFDRYGELDFDGSLLAGAHAVAGVGLRARLAERARAGGRTEVPRCSRTTIQ